MYTPPFLTQNCLCREEEKLNTKGVIAENKNRNNEGCLNELLHKAKGPDSIRAVMCPWGCIFWQDPASCQGRPWALSQLFPSLTRHAMFEFCQGITRLLSSQSSSRVQWGNELRRFVGVHTAAGSAHAIHVKSINSALFVLIWCSYRSSCYWAWIFYWQDKHS